MSAENHLTDTTDGALPDESVIQLAPVAEFLPPRRGRSVGPALPLKEAVKAIFGRVPRGSYNLTHADKKYEGWASRLRHYTKGDTLLSADPEDAGRTLRLMQSSLMQRWKGGPLIDIAVAAGGLSFATAAFVHSLRLPAAPSKRPLELATRLRELLAASSTTEEETCRLRMEATWGDERNTYQIIAATYLFPDHAPYRVPALDVYAKREILYDLGYAKPFLRADIRSLEESHGIVAIAQMAVEPESVVPALETLPQEVMRFAHDILTYDGGSAGTKGGPIFAKLVACIPTEEAMAFLVERIGIDRFRAGVTAAAESYPVRALRHLGPIATGRTTDKDLAKPIVGAILRRHPAAFDAAGFEGTLLEKMSSVSDALGVPRPVAFEDCPDVLRVPRSRRKNAAPWPAWTKHVTPPELKTGGSLPREAVDNLLLMLAVPRTDKVDASLREAREHLIGTSLARSSWSLFEAWRTGGMDAEHKWAFQQLGLLGDDRCARELSPILRAWQSDGKRHYAGEGLNVLASIGSDVALMHLDGIAQKLKNKGLGKRAAAKVAEIAQTRGLSDAELADRLVPTFDLEEDGGELNFGPRTFHVSFDEALKPVIRDAKGKLRKSLPKVGAKDDATLGRKAAERFRNLRKDVKMVAAMQVARLEQAMCDSRRWVLADFEDYLVRHPLMFHIARRLVWGVYQDRSLTHTFRVGADQSFTNATDDAFKLAEGMVGVVHPIELDDATQTAWAGVFDDYLLVQPFEQLERSVFEPTPEEAKNACVKRHAGEVVDMKNVLSLESHGWRRGTTDNAIIGHMERPGAHGVFVLPMDPGIDVRALNEAPRQTLGTVVLRPTKSIATYRNVLEVFWSETIRSLALICNP